MNIREFLEKKFRPEKILHKKAKKQQIKIFIYYLCSRGSPRLFFH